MVVAGATSAASAAPQLILTPSPASVSVGDSFSLSVEGRGFADIALTGGGFDLTFDQTLLALDSASINTTLWEFGSSIGVIDNSTGRVEENLFNTFVLRPPVDEFVVATFNFTALGAGHGAVSLLANTLFPFANTDGEVITVEFGRTDVNISAVPVPSALYLLLPALLPMLRARRRAA